MRSSVFAFFSTLLVVHNTPFQENGFALAFVQPEIRQVARLAFLSSATSSKDSAVAQSIVESPLTEATASTSPAVTEALATVDLEDNRKGFHLGVLSAGTLWWYAYSTFSFFTTPTDLFANIPSWAITSLAVYTTLSQIIVYGCMWKLSSAKTLREAQGWTVASILLCVPADISVVLFDPTGSAALTAGIFAFVTMLFALFFVHYVRLAAMREEFAGLAKAPSLDPAMHHGEHPQGPVGELRDYRPPRTLRSFDLAVDFTRSFVAFTLAMAGFRGALFGDEAGNLLVIASCTLVAFHTSIQMILTTVFPGSDLEEYKSINALDAGIALGHIASASIIGHESAFGETIWDELLYSWLFGNAAAGFFASVNMLLRDFDFDHWMGLKKKPIQEAVGAPE